MGCWRRRAVRGAAGTCAGSAESSAHTYSAPYAQIRWMTSRGDTPGELGWQPPQRTTAGSALFALRPPAWRGTRATFMISAN